MSTTDRIPAGWRFYTADGSIPGRVSVMLTRSPEHKVLWLALPDHEREYSNLFVPGRGTTLDEALDDAIRCLTAEDLEPPESYVHKLGDAA